MKLLLNTEDYTKYLFQCLAKSPQSIIISTYGLYAGITYKGENTNTWGEKYQLASYELLTIMKSVPKVKILVGLYPYRCCKLFGKCIDCEAQYVRQLLRLLNHAEAFPEFEWKINAACHMKCILFNYGKYMIGVAGSRNFGGTEWADISVTLDIPSIKEILIYYNKLWKDSMIIDSNAITTFLEKQKISQEGFEATIP